MSSPEPKHRGRHPLFAFACRHVYTALTLVVLVFAIFAIRSLVLELDVREVWRELDALRASTLAAAILATFTSYLFLVGYDWSALRYIGRRVKAPVLLVGAFSAYAIGYTVGLSALSGAAVRNRFYRPSGLDGKDVAMVSTYCAMAYGTGVTVMGLGALLFRPSALAPFVALDPGTVRLISACVLVALFGLLAFGSISGRAVPVWRYRIRVPPPPMLALQLALSLFDIAFAAVTLYLLLPSGLDIGFPTFLALYSVAAVAGIISHVPGGIGVFDGILVAGVASAPGLLAGVAAAVLAYRVIYFLLPFSIAVAVLLGSAWWQGSARVAKP